LPKIIVLLVIASKKYRIQHKKVTFDLVKTHFAKLKPPKGLIISIILKYQKSLLYLRYSKKFCENYHYVIYQFTSGKD